MKIIWSHEAIFDLGDLRSYISEDNPKAAKRVALSIVRMVETVLPAYPAYGKAGRVSGTRELVIPKIPVIVPYRIRGEGIEILRIYHQARRWPDHF